MGGRLTLSRWRTVAATTTGSSHRARNEDGQDAVAVASLDDGRVVMAVADGAGSAPLAAEGSQAAVAAVIAAVAAGADLADAFATARDALGDDETRPLRATTLLVAVLHDDGLVEAAQVGDGFLVARAGDATWVLCAGAEREYLNETTFLSSTSWADDLRVEETAGVDAVAVLSDGLQLVAVELATGTPFAGFFDPLFAWATGDGASDDDLAAFLASPRLAERTDDDLSLALAALTPRP